MATFLMFGNYTSAAIEGMSSKRTREAGDIVRKRGGKVKSIFALLGENDLVFVVDLPDVETAMQVSLALHKATGIAFKTSPAVDVKAFDKLAAEV